MILKSYFSPYMNKRPGMDKLTCAGEVETNLEDLIQVFRSTYISDIRVGVETLSVDNITGGFDFIEGSEEEIQALKTALEEIMRSSFSHSCVDGGHLD